jgi:glycosyltransferase involved in cell wall biosynthesis
MAESPLRILQISTADIRGGAEKVAWSLFSEYRRRGHASWLAVGEKHSDDPDVLTIPNEASRGAWYHAWHGLAGRLRRPQGRMRVETSLGRVAERLAEPGVRLRYHLGIENFHYPGTSRLLRLAGSRPDILHAHNLHGAYFDLRKLPWLSHQVPLVLTLHDAWLLSGHCAHSFACERWRTGCGHCPDLTIYPAIRRDQTGANWLRKRRIYERSRLHVATPSRWLMRRVEQSMLGPSMVEGRVLPNGVDLSTFHPVARDTARAELGIRQDARILVTTGVGIRESRWKDYPTLREAMGRVAGDLVGQSLLLFALGEDAPPERLGSAEIRFLPFQRSPELVARYYQAADIYVHAARADTYPTAILEALACGTPVVATAVGGIPEQIEEGCTGFLVPAGDAIALGARLTQLLSGTDGRQTMGTLAAAAARDRFGLDRQADAYLEWYHELVGRQARQSSEHP